MGWENTVKAFPFKGSAKRQRDGWDEKLKPTEYSNWMDSDTNRFTQILFDAHGWSKKEQEQFMEHLVDEPEMWQDKYEVFRRALDMRHYSNDRIEDDLSEHSFADWFKDEFDADWDDLEAYLNDMQLKRDAEAAGENMWKSMLKKEKTPQERATTTPSPGQDEEAAKRTQLSEHEILEELKRKNAEARANLKQPAIDNSPQTKTGRPFQMGYNEDRKKFHRDRDEKIRRQKEMDKKRQTGLGDF